MWIAEVATAWERCDRLQSEWLRFPLITNERWTKLAKTCVRSDNMRRVRRGHLCRQVRAQPPLPCDIKSVEHRGDGSVLESDLSLDRPVGRIVLSTHPEQHLGQVAEVGEATPVLHLSLRILRETLTLMLG